MRPFALRRGMACCIRNGGAARFALPFPLRCRLLSLENQLQITIRMIGQFRQIGGDLGQRDDLADDGATVHFAGIQQFQCLIKFAGTGTAANDTIAAQALTA